MDMGDKGNSQLNKPMLQRFVINLFGESGAGKTTVLQRLIDILRVRAKYSLEVAEDFLVQDRKAVMWYRSGKQYSGTVCVCAKGDSLGLIKGNFDFFEKHNDVPKAMTPWTSWEKACGKELSKTEMQNTTKHKLPVGVLVTASRKPLECYKGLLSGVKSCSVLNVPIRVDACCSLNLQKNSCEWMASARTVPEVLLFHVNYVLRHAKFKANKKNLIDPSTLGLSCAL